MAIWYHLAVQGRGPDANGAIERRERATDDDRTAARRPAVDPPRMAHAVPGAVGGSRTDRHRRRRRAGHAAPPGRASACADGLLRSRLLRGPPLRCADIQGADRRYEYRALTRGLHAGRRPGTTAIAGPRGASRAAPQAPPPGPAEPRARAGTNAEVDLAAGSRPDAHLAALAMAAPVAAAPPAPAVVVVAVASGRGAARPSPG
jgi:hypothetical protein